MTGSPADEELLQVLGDLPATGSVVGVFVSQVGNIATVDQASSRLQVKSVTQTPCLPGDAVRLEWRGDELVMLGPTVPRAAVGKITATGNPATVEYPAGSGVTAVLPVMNGATLAVGDLVFLDWSTAGLIVGRINIPVAPEVPDDPSGPGGGTRTERFYAIDSGSFQSGYGWRTNDVWSSASNIGAWFYGSKIRDTIPDNASIQSASIVLPLRERLGAAPFGRHSAEQKPSGSIAIVSTGSLPNLSGEVSIPTGLIDHLKSNPGGLGFDFGGKNIWTGTQNDGESGRVTVTYTT